jgi:hypothetical protein
MARTFSSVLYGSGEDGHYCLTPYLGGKIKPVGFS